MPKATEARREREPSAYSEKKIANILEAARALFTSNGYGATSMDAVAAQAGVGKATVYAHFKSKTDLFSAVIVREGGQVLLSPVSTSGENIGIILGRFARDAFELILRPTTTAVFRVVAAEAPRFPELGEVFYDSGPQNIQDELANILEMAMERGDLRREQPRIAACQFLALICGDLQLREFMGLGLSVSGAHRTATLTSGLDAFLRAYCLRDNAAIIRDALAAAAAPPEAKRRRRT